MPSYEEMMDAFRTDARLKTLTRYCKVYGPHRNPGSDPWYFNIERSGALSVAQDITVPEFRGRLRDRGQRGNGRFVEELTARAIDEAYGDDLRRLVEVVLRALRRKPGAW